MWADLGSLNLTNILKKTAGPAERVEATVENKEVGYCVSDLADGTKMDRNQCHWADFDFPSCFFGQAFGIFSRLHSMPDYMKIP